MKKKGLVIALSVMLVLCLAVGGTLAWLNAQTGPVVNTFTYGDINITLDEEDIDGSTEDKERDQVNTYKMVPGNKIAKDPIVTVKADSEASWLFVKVTEVNDYDAFMAYAIAEGWTLYDTTTTGADIDTATNDTYVIYREVAATKEDTPFNVLGAGSKVIDEETYTWDANQVLVLPTVTKNMMEAIKADATKAPQLTFTAYAVQRANFDNVADAWTEAQKLS